MIRGTPLRQKTPEERLAPSFPVGEYTIAEDQLPTVDPRLAHLTYRVVRRLIRDGHFKWGVEFVTFAPGERADRWYRLNSVLETLARNPAFLLSRPPSRK